MALPIASQMKPKKINPDLLKEIERRLTNNRTGKVVILCGSHIYSDATVEDAAYYVKQNGFNVSYSQNSYGVKTMVITW